MIVEEFASFADSCDPTENLSDIRVSCVFPSSFRSVSFHITRNRLVRGIHFLLLACFNYAWNAIGFMPFFHYSELYLLIIDECNNALVFFIFIHYAMIWQAFSPAVTHSIHSLNTHPAIIVIQDKIDMRLHFLLSFIVLVLHFFHFQTVILYIITTMVLYCLSILSGRALVVSNSIVFSVLECYVIIQLLRYVRQLKELLQWDPLLLITRRQTLISVEIKWKQYKREVGIVSFSIIALVLRILFRVLPFVGSAMNNVAVLFCDPL